VSATADTATTPVGKAAGTSVSHRLPGTFQQLFILARWQWRDYLRARRFLILFAIVTSIGIAATAVIAYFRPEGLLSNPRAFYGSIWGGGVPGVILLAGIMLGGDAIAGEFQNKTGYFLMGLPIRRVTVYVGKYLAALTASTVMVLYFALLMLLNGLFYFGADAFPWQFAASLGMAFLYLLALLGFTFFFSSLFKTSSYATLLTAVLFLFGFGILQALISFLAHEEPWMIISYSSPIIGNIFADPYPPHILPPEQTGAPFPIYNPTIETGIAIMVSYLVVSAVVGLWFFERKEFT
jgi:ABC-2 type transport system permease protein